MTSNLLYILTKIKLENSTFVFISPENKFCVSWNKFHKNLVLYEICSKKIEDDEYLCPWAILYMNRGVLQDPTEPLHPTLQVASFLLSHRYRGNGRVCCCYHKAARLWKRTRRSKEIYEIITNSIYNKHEHKH
jgi:hypothetical protein